MLKLISIYQIRNLVNGKLYIGSSLWTQKRFPKHKNDLIKGKHSNLHLQASWNKYGQAAFAFEILETLPSSTLEIPLRNKEQEYINKLNTLNLGYNMALSTLAPMTGRKPSARAITILRERMKTFRHTEESKEKIAESNRRRKGETRSAEVKAKLSAAHTGLKHKPMSSVGRTNISKAQKLRCEQGNVRTGWHHTEESRMLQSAKAKERGVSEQAKARLRVSCIGKKWYNNGQVSKRFSPDVIVPAGFVCGRITSQVGLK